MAKKADAFKYPGPWIIKKAMLAHMGVDDHVVFDVGAYKGDVMAYYRRMWPHAQIFAFEPVPQNVEHLRQRYATDPLVTIIPKALAQRAGARRIYTGGQDLEMSSLMKRPTDAQSRRYFRHELDGQILVEATTVDTFCQEHSIERIHVFKVDVQGGESRVFEGAGRMLEEGRIDLIYTEVFFVPMYWRAALFWEMCQILDVYGFTLHSLYLIGISKVTFQTKYADALFISDEVRKASVDKMPEEWLAKNHRSLIDGV